MNRIYSWQQGIWQQLTHNHGFRGHALLLKGKKGIGKFEFARNLAKSWLCANPTVNNEACGECPSCGWFDQGGHPNFYQIEPTGLAGETAQNSGDEERNTKSRKKSSQQISVEQIRMLTKFVYLSGHQDGYKIILIHPAETMNLAAASALLKKLEEPPAQVLFILVTHRPQYLLPTIRSRCQQIVMPSPDIATAIEWLKQQGIDDPETYLAAAGFAPLAALLFTEDEYAAQHAQFIEQIGAPNYLDPLLMAETMQQLHLPTVVSWLQKWCYDLLSFHTTGKIRYYSYQQHAIKILAGPIDPKALTAYLRHLITAQRLSNHPLNPRLFLEEILIAYGILVNKR